MAEQNWNSKDYQKHASFVSELGNEVIELLNPQVDECILDLGCGEGTIALRLQQLGCIVQGVDYSEDMVRSTQEKGVDAKVMDGQKLRFDQSFDAVFSNAALHWMPDQQAVYDGAYKALKNSGRFVVEMGGAGNIMSIVETLEESLPHYGGFFKNPWTFPTINETKERLERSGFQIASIQLFDRPTHIPTDVRGWLSTFTSNIVATVEEDQREALLAHIYDFLKPKLCNSQNQWILDYRRLRFCALKSD